MAVLPARPTLHWNRVRRHRRRDRRLEVAVRRRVREQDGGRGGRYVGRYLAWRKVNTVGGEAEFTRLENHPQNNFWKFNALNKHGPGQTWREGCLSWHRLQRSLVGPRGCRIRAEGSARCLQIRLHHELDVDVSKRVLNIPKGHSTRFHFLVTMRR